MEGRDILEMDGVRYPCVTREISRGSDKNMKKPTAAMTAKRAEHIKPHPTKRLEVPCGVPPGLSLIVHPSGKKVFAWRYRYAGQTRKQTIGTYTTKFGLAAARMKTVELLAVLESGNDPARVWLGESNTVSAIGEEWLKRAVTGKRTEQDMKWMMRREIIEPWKHRQVSDIKLTDAVRLLDKIVDRGAPVGANRVLTLMKSWFSWCVQRGIVAVSPVANLKPPTVEVARERVLGADELALIWGAAQSMPYPRGPWLQVLMLLCQRRTETARMRWSEIDSAAGIWHMPSSTAKMGKPQDVALCPTVLAILKTVTRYVGGDYVWSHAEGARPITTFDEAKAEVEVVLESAGHKLPQFGFHDFRRSFATWAGDAGIPPHIADLVLSHSRSVALGSVASVYNKNEYSAERRDALQRWADHVVALEKPVKVIAGTA